MPTKRDTYKLRHVIHEEQEHLKKRREKLFGEKSAEDFEGTKFGIALSGGGIRSATINLGVLKTLNLFNILKRADYLSSVSGGGYTGSYIQATLKSKGDYDALFKKERIDHMRLYGEYLTPGQNIWRKRWNMLLLVVGFLGSFGMSLLSLGLGVVMITIIYILIGETLNIDSGEFERIYNQNFDFVYKYGFPTLIAVISLHFLANISFIFNLKISKFFTKIESGLIFLAILVFVVVVFISFQETHFLHWTTYLLSFLGLLIIWALGFFINPNGLSFHRFYRNQLSEAFLHDTGDCENVYLKHLCQVEDQEDKKVEKKDYLAPFPLINTCLNIQTPDGDDKIKGSKASDYFLLSPLFCGAKLTNYVSTKDFIGYKEMTLPAATTISAAAVNPGMGMYSNRFLSMLMTLFNFRLGFWVNNPIRNDSSYRVWWPKIFFRELFSNINTKLSKINISDGGHIENLAVYELLRRRCRLILAVDGGADPSYSFADLENLAVRARNELGLEIAFREGHNPEEIIRPKPSKGYSEKRFAVADIYKVWEEFILEEKKDQPYTYEVCNPKTGESKTEKLEVLVNYYVEDEVIKPIVILKIHPNAELTNEEKEEFRKKAGEKVLTDLGNHSEKGKKKLKVGTFVYIKSSVTAPKGKPFLHRETPDGEPDYRFNTYKYKIYHPNFPHESTADQFFDPVQWESYFQLGQFIGADVLGVNYKDLDDYNHKDKKAKDVSFKNLLEWIDEDKPLFKKKKKLKKARGVEEEAPIVLIDEDDLELGYEM